MNDEINLEYLQLIDECYKNAIEQALIYRGNFDIETTGRLTELLFMFKYRIKQKEQRGKIAKRNEVNT